jgi:hypothetical protein
MQLSPVLAQPPVAASTSASPFLSILTTLRGERPPASAAATSAAAPTAPASPAATTAAAAVEASQPSLGAKLLGGVADKQNSYLANQQMLAVITAGLGARFSTIAKGVWSMLRGTEPQSEAPPAA